MVSLRKFRKDEQGAVTVSASWLLGIFIIITGAGIEMAHAYFQSNTMRHAVEIGVRNAATGAPVALELAELTGLGNGVDSGDPMPDYKIVCSGETLSCNRGGFDASAFDKIFYGRDEDGVCGNTDRERRGVCDLLDKIKIENVSVSYEASGLGRAGNPADIIPLVTVSISGVQRDYVFLDMVSSAWSDQMTGASAVAIAEDLK